MDLDNTIIKTCFVQIVVFVLLVIIIAIANNKDTPDE